MKNKKSLSGLRAVRAETFLPVFFGYPCTRAENEYIMVMFTDE